jgi:putative membrane protein
VRWRTDEVGAHRVEVGDRYGSPKDKFMQLLLILGIAFAIGAVTFAVQNNVPVAVSLASWHYDGSLAVVLLVALALGALIAGLVSTPSVIRGQWMGARLRRQVAILEDHKVSLERRIFELEGMLPGRPSTAAPAVQEIPSYVGMRTLLTANEGAKPVAS